MEGFTRLFSALAVLGLLSGSAYSKPTEDLQDENVAQLDDANPIYTLSRDPNDIQFFYFANSDDVNATKEIVYNDAQSVKDSGIIPGRKTVIITHGFRSNLSSDMPQTMKNAFLQANQAQGLNYNIIVTSWGPLSTPMPPDLTGPLYSLVVPNVPIVAQRVADFVLFLQDQNVLSLDDVHLIGHSLGSHVSGLAGRNVFLATSSKIPRITGLDPAGPLFFPPLPTRNLMKEDADFVDVIHTNAGVLGDQTSDGHVDFWPNGGASQPGCVAGDTNISNPNTIGRCSHWYAYQLYEASISRTFLACPCTLALQSSKLGLCSTTCDNPVPIGFNVPTSASGDYYLQTTNPI